MLKILFSAEDVARTRIAATADPLWELVLSIQMLRGQRGDLLFTEWRRTTAAALRGNAPPGTWRTLIDLVPLMGYFPDFLTPADANRGLPHGLEAVRSTPAPVLADEIHRLAAGPPAGDGPALAAGDPAALRRLTGTMAAYHQLAVEPLSGEIEAAVRRDRRHRLRALVNGGMEAALATFQPMATWSYGELRIPAHRDQVIDLEGRGLVLVPSYFCIQHPITLFDPLLPPVLVYPVRRTAGDILAQRKRRDNLAKLIGGTRVAVLEAMSTECTTTEIARRLRISPASASEHATVLRDAGLSSAHRDGRRVYHVLTRLGRDLLDGRAAAAGD